MWNSFSWYYWPKRIQGESWLRAAAFGSLRWVSNILSRTSMKDSNMAIPALVPGFAHSGSPTVLSTCREARVSAQSTGCEVKRKNSDSETMSSNIQKKEKEMQASKVVMKVWAFHLAHVIWRLKPVNGISTTALQWKHTPCSFNIWCWEGNLNSGQSKKSSVYIQSSINNVREEAAEGWKESLYCSSLTSKSSPSMSLQTAYFSLYWS